MRELIQKQKTIKKYTVDLVSYTPVFINRNNIRTVGSPAAKRLIKYIYVNKDGRLQIDTHLFITYPMSQLHCTNYNTKGERIQIANYYSECSGSVQW